MDDHKLRGALCAIVGTKGLHDSTALAEQDPGYHPQNLAGSFLVQPESTAQVVELVRLCQRSRRALIPQDGLTGLVGGSAS